jgi:hypothetical protein
MSLLANHGLIGRLRLVPSVVGYNQDVQAGSTYTVTPFASPTEGNLLIISCAGSNTVAVTSGPSGFTQSTLPFTGIKLFLKVATASEPGTYSITFSGALFGGSMYTEIKDSEYDLLQQRQAGPTNTNGLSFSSYDAPNAGIAVTYSQKNLTTNWTTDNGTVNQSGPGQHKVSHKIYPIKTTGEVITWSGPIQTVSTELFFINGKLIS